MSPRGQSIAANAPSRIDPPLWRTALGILALFLVNVVAIAAFLATAADAAGEGVASARGSGALLLKSEDDRYVEAPVVGTDVDLLVSGPTARARDGKFSGPLRYVMHGGAGGRFVGWVKAPGTGSGVAKFRARRDPPTDPCP